MSTSNKGKNLAQDNNNPSILPNIPASLEEIQEQLLGKEITITIPITVQKDVIPTLQILRQYYSINQIPDYILNLPPLSTPTWDLFIQPNQ